MKPLDSNTIRSLVAAEILLLLQWLTVSLTAGAWDWKSLVLGTIAIVTPLVKRLMDPDVDAPLAILNRANPLPKVGGTEG